MTQQLVNVVSNLLAVTIMVAKAAILLELLRIFAPQTRNYFYWTTVFLLVVNIVWYTVGVIVANLICVPHEKLWNRVQVSGTCMESDPLHITAPVINFVIDVIILILPQKVIWGLEMSFKRRLGVSAVFTVGLM